ncbi:hypothetical protein MSZK_32070 [Mycobacterium sp. shizuoka-1]|nr:hypothetical protein MSZK_32070 [Mycobacterium sp. shizuoka-1]
MEARTDLGSEAGLEPTAELSTTTGTEAATQPGAEARADPGAQTDTGLPAEFSATADFGTHAGVETGFHLDAQSGLEPAAKLSTTTGTEAATEPGAEADPGRATHCGSATEFSAESGTNALAQAQADAVAHGGSQGCTAVDTEVQRLVSDHVRSHRGCRQHARHDALDRREAELIGNRLRQAGDRVAADELQSWHGRCRDGLNLLRGDVSQPRVRQRRVGVRHECLRGGFVVEQVKDELEQGVHWEFLPNLFRKLDRRPRPVITSHGMKNPHTLKWGTVPYPVHAVPGYPSNPR